MKLIYVLIAGSMLLVQGGCSVGDTSETSLLDEAPILSIIESTVKPHLSEFNGAFSSTGGQLLPDMHRFMGTARFPDTSLETSEDVAQMLVDAIIDEIRRRGGKVDGGGASDDIKIANYRYGDHEGFLTLTLHELKSNELRIVVVGEEHW